MNQVTFKGSPVQLENNLPVVGDKAPDFSLVNEALEEVSLRSFAGKKKLLTINPSFDTPVCASTARHFNEKAASLDNVVVLAISADLPFAQKRFCSSEGIENVVPLSSYRSTFAKDYGVFMVDGPLAALTARAVIVIDENDTVSYVQLVGEIVDEPDYDAALAALK